MNYQQAIQFLELFAMSVGVTPDSTSPTLAGAPHAVQSGQVVFQMDKAILRDYGNDDARGINLNGVGTDYVVGLNLKGTVHIGKITFGRP